MLHLYHWFFFTAICYCLLLLGFYLQMGLGLSVCEFKPQLRQIVQNIQMLNIPIMLGTMLWSRLLCWETNTWILNYSRPGSYFSSLSFEFFFAATLLLTRAYCSWFPVLHLLSHITLLEKSLTCCPDMEFLEVLTEGLERVLLVRGGGSEVITIYSW